MKCRSLLLGHTVPEDSDGVIDAPTGVGQRLAVVQGLQLGEVLVVSLHQVGHPEVIVYIYILYS